MKGCVLRLSALSVILPFLLIAIPAAGNDYPYHGDYPTPMGNAFKKQGVYNADGTLASNPVIDTGQSQTIDSITYTLKKLSSDDSITFEGNPYTVYSAIPQDMDIGYVYSHIKEQYDPDALTNIGGIDYARMPETLNSGQNTVLSGQILSPYTKENAFVTQPSDDAKYFIPNLSNGSGQHDGATANVFWTVDAYKGQSGYQPNGDTYHLVGYGWAQEGAAVNQAFGVYGLPMDGGSSIAMTVVHNAATPFNYWLKLFSNEGSIRTDLYNTIKSWSDKKVYPFPLPQWLQNGVYVHYHAMPGFQRNILRWYTAWGDFNLLDNTSGLFVRNDGSVELPAYQDGSNWKLCPLVVQTWDGSQRFTAINQTKNVIPSTYTDYPGGEKYFGGQYYLPGKAAVIPSVVDYQVYDNTGLANRQVDAWLGLKGARPQDVQVWDDADRTEPGGQANKPYMLGANSSGGQYSIRMEHSNSFLIARLEASKAQGKIYDVEFYRHDGKDYKLVARLGYSWQSWTIGDDGKWKKSSDNKGALIPEITSVDSTFANEAHVKTIPAASWDKSARVMGWQGGRSYQSGDKNTLEAVPQKYNINFTSSDDTKYLVVFKDRALDGSSASAKVLWSKQGGYGGIWTLDDSDNFQGSQLFGPYNDWKAVSYDNLFDGSSRLLWSSTSGEVVLWSLDSSDAFVGYTLLGAYPGWNPVGYQGEMDGSAKLLWSAEGGYACIWTLDSSGAFRSMQSYGPCSGWAPVGYERLSDGSARLLWSSTSGEVVLWSLDSSDAFIGYTHLGAYPGWNPVSYDR